MSDNKSETAGAGGMNEFFTRGKANEGLKLPLYLPDGTKSEHWVQVLGVDSDAFRQADAEHRRDAFRIAGIEDLGERSRAIEESKLTLVATLVVAWSFDKPCNVATVSEFFREAPQIMDAIDRAASKRALFFVNRSSASESTPSTSSAST
ncbi:hypothetical protein P9A47_gp37 [Xanthomonas phage Elanor]|uniref:Tail assembly chaperone n=1 Tax=Xanthomonas phage Elanor TaxID=2939127 RepID=A0A9E7E3B3_9CAUD|nr:hypothetical protein P9A47_gp37 [Xanthomonas phage Elanor]URA07005.1 hypothetical protein Elanor_BL40037 [Xanthomonas phage Elanor]